MGHDYSITYVPSGTLSAGGDMCWGLTDTNEQTIQVEEGLSHDKERSITLHESLHQMITYSGLELDDETEEAIVSYLGDALVGHMRDNPSFWRYLVQRPAKK